MSLSQPKFCKISDIRPGQHCYNVYCKVLSVEENVRVNSKGEDVKMVVGIVGDETGCAKFKFVSERAEEVKKGNIIAIRNGKSVVIDEKIELQIDSFGKISKENVKIEKVNE